MSTFLTICALLYFICTANAKNGQGNDHGVPSLTPDDVSGDFDGGGE
ncbi:MAG: hypothetical protein ACKV2Q_24505 [Planctomycetaceae bacterium]